MKYRIASVHEKKKPFKFDTCDVRFAKNQNVDNSEHDGKKTYKCDTCGTCFAQDHDLK